jgi:hypothetical protein
MPTKSTQRKVGRLLAEWQRMLRLQDWVIQVRIVRQEEFGSHEIQGDLSRNLERREAMVRLLDPVDYSPDSMVPENMERTLVHELVHLLLSGIGTKDGTPEALAEEQAVHSLDLALLTLRRGGQ